MRISLGSAATLLVALTCVSAGVAAQGSGQVKTAPITYTNIASGPEMYGAYCAACHGKDGKGKGPAAAELKTPPSDLTTLAKRHDGKFPTESVMQVLRNGPATAKAHGSADMPMWGSLFSSIGEQGSVTQRIFNLTKYLESIQAK